MEKRKETQTNLDNTAGIDPDQSTNTTESRIFLVVIPDVSQWSTPEQKNEIWKSMITSSSHKLAFIEFLKSVLKTL